MMKQLERMPPRYPTNVTLELTLRCNLHCAMCMFRHSDGENPKLSAGELTAAQWEDMARGLRDAGTLNVLITGGEPMLREDFCRIYSGIYRMGFIITLYTNATLVDERIMETLRRYPPHRIGVTLYGASNETYRTLCGCADGFDRALEGARSLASLPSLMEFRTTLVRDNAADLPAMEELVKREFGRTLTHTSTVFQSVRGGCMQVADRRLSPEQALSLTLGRVVERVRQNTPPEWQGKISLQLREKKPECRTGESGYTLLGCGGGMDSCTITWDGKLLGCQMLDAFQTDALSLGFEQAWARWPETVRLPAVHEACAQCSCMDLCTVCPGVRMAECGNLYDVPQYICRLTKGLAEKKGINLL